MEDYLTIQALAKKVGVSDQSVYAWLKKGLLASVKVGRGVRIPREEVERFLAVGGESK